MTIQSCTSNGIVLIIYIYTELRGETERVTQGFIQTMEARYPDDLQGHTFHTIGRLYERLYEANCNWSPNHPLPVNMDIQSGGHDYSNTTLPSPSNPEHKLPDTGTFNHGTNIRYSHTRNRTITPATHLPNKEASSSHVISEEKVYSEDSNKLWEDIAHGMHKASITILGILFVEVTVYRYRRH